MEIPQATSELTLWAGAATADLTLAGKGFLFGYPHVARTSTGVHDRLESAALYLRQGNEAANALFAHTNGPRVVEASLALLRSDA